jgi:5'-3' exonuclease
MEADDLGAILCDRYTAQGSKIVLLTGDKDWLQLIGPGVVWRDFINNRLVNQTNFEEMTGVSTIKQFLEIKALSGDMGDGVPGVGGIGAKGALEFVKEYGCFADFTNNVIFHKTIDLKKLPKKYRDLVEKEEKAMAYALNIKLVDLRTTARPAVQNLIIDKGEPSYEKFHQFCELLMFRSITQELAEFLRIFPAFHYLNHLEAA